MAKKLNQPELNSYNLDVYRKNNDQKIIIPNTYKQNIHYWVIITKILPVIVFFAVILIIAILVRQYVDVQSVSYQEVSMGSINNNNFLEGLIIRDEIIYASPVTGNFTYFIEEGQKIKKDALIGTVATNSIPQDYEKELQPFNITDDYIKKNISNIFIKKQELDYIDLIDKYNQTSDNLLKEEINNLRLEIDKIMQKKNATYNENKNIANNANYQSIYTNSVEVLSQIAGTISYKIDGYENLQKEMKYKDFTKLIEDIPLEDIQEISLSVNQDEPLLKVISDYIFNIVTYVDREQGTDYQVGKEYKLSIQNQAKNKLNATLIRKENDDGMTKLIFEIKEYLINFLDNRKIEFIIGEVETTGLKIPLESIVEKNIISIPSSYVVIQKDKYDNNIYGINKITSVGPSFTEIEIYSRTDDITNIFLPAFDEDIKINDTIFNIETGETYILDKIEIITGVFVINQGFAKFKEIEIAVENAEYAVLTTDSSTELEQKDQIISNPKGIEENDLVKDFNLKNK
ncbi:hypothetical protein AN641_00680 [Candidatus Epulonipiscioides gigas]|nr:hypothetical protein AN641_00680 [Epulopiscium sp. SCG-C07WGA-EpuloA2]